MAGRIGPVRWGPVFSGVRSRGVPQPQLPRAAKGADLVAGGSV